MQSFDFKVLFLAIILLLTAGMEMVKCQISLEAYQIPHAENFNTLAITGSSNTIVPFGWHFTEERTNGNGYYTASDGSTGGGNTYSFGKTGSTERAFGSIASGTVKSSIGAKFINNTGGVITRLLVTYKGECWRSGMVGRSDKIDFQYSSNATNLSTGTWYDHNLLDFTGPQSSVSGSLDGNALENSKIISSEITGLNLPQGANFWIKFVDFDVEFTDDGLAIDDFSITPSDTCTTVIESFFPVDGPLNTEVTLVGKNFTGVTKVMFGGKEAKFEVIDNFRIRTYVPEGANSGRINCVNHCCEISYKDFQVLGSNCTISSSLIISELCDPQKDYETDRFIEIYNPTILPVNLDGWTLRAIANNAPDSTCGSMVLCWNLQGLINPGQALTCGYDKAIHVTHDFKSFEWITTSSANGSCYYWNGQWRDGAALYNGEIKVDGVIRDNLENYWYNDRSLIRKYSICSGNPLSSYLEWEVTDSVEFANQFPATPRSHHTTCNKTSMPVFNQHPVSMTACDGEPAAFEVSVSGGIQPLTYKWMIQQNSSAWRQVINDSRFSEEQTAVLRIQRLTSDLDGMQFYCIITNADGDCYLASEAVQLKVNKKPQGNIIKHM